MLKHVFYTLGSRLLSALLNFSTIIILSRYLGAAGKGISALFITEVSFMVILSEFVGGSTLVYLVPRFNLRSLMVPALIWITFIITIYTLLATQLNWLPSGTFTFMQLFLSGFLLSVYSVLQKTLSSYERFEILSMLNVFQASVLVILLLLMFRLGSLLQPSAYAIAIIISYLLSVLIAVIDLVKHNPKNDLPNAGFNELVKLGFTNQTAHVFHLISTRFAFWALIQFSGTDTTGIFSNAIQIAEAVWVITNSFATVQYAKISNSTNHNNSIKLTNLLGRVTFVITALILTGVNLLPESFYLSLFGQDFIGIKLPLFILSIGTIFFNWMLIYGHYFSGQGIYKFNTLSVIISSVFTVASFLLIGKNLNLINASILTALSYIITGGIIFFIYLNKTHQKISILIPKKEDLLMLKNMF